jgi:hypothetical protein
LQRRNRKADCCHQIPASAPTLIDGNIANWDPACITLVFERVAERVLGLGEADPIKVKEGEQNFQRYAEVLDGNLKGGKFVTGNTLTIADFFDRRVAELGGGGKLSPRRTSGNQAMACRADGVAGVAEVDPHAPGLSTEARYHHGASPDTHARSRRPVE